MPLFYTKNRPRKMVCRVASVAVGGKGRKRNGGGEVHRVAAVHEGKELGALGNGGGDEGKDVVVDDLSCSGVVARAHGRVHAAGLVTVEVLGLRSVARVVEEERIA